ncbi:MAG: DNA adenine methylase [Acidobacteriota bacterium]|nr:DNA adenine methylase [Acidobacteriota bacterium]MDQ5837997.1 DNA adenine methylase [Acidobacteriota bacterium]
MRRSRAGKRAPQQPSLFKRSDLARPFLKWAGGKGQLLREIRRYVPREFGTYSEPFVGAGAVLFDLQPPRAVINDANEELINCYRVVKSNPEELIRLAAEHERNDSENYFYKIRSLDREPGLRALTPAQRAARVIYLNKTCFNGLYRVNGSGYFNVPYRKHVKPPQIVDPEVIRAVSRYLNEASVEIRSGDFRSAVAEAAAGDFVYFDPPYVPASKSASFTAYAPGGFGEESQRALKKLCDELTERGCCVLVSNSDTELVRDLFRNRRRYAVREVKARRNINSVGTRRGKVGELLIFNNYDVAKTEQE